jgi:ribose 5-phosphate isomerase B
MKNLSPVIFGADHAGLPLKQFLMASLQEKGTACEDMGTDSLESTDYPIYAARTCRRVLETGSFGVLICGTGLGMSMTANRLGHIRAGLCSNEYMARMARAHNNANLLCLGSRVVGEDLALSILEAFLGTEFEGGRHQRRVDLIESADNL